MERGTVAVINAKEYAGNEGVSLAFKAVLDRILPEILTKETVYAEGDRDVQFAVYRQNDRSTHVYFMATDWYNAPDLPRHGTLIVGEHRYTVPAPLGSPIKAVVNGDLAAWCNDWENDVLSVSDGTVRVQGTGRANVTVAKNGETETITVDFTEEAVQTISV